MLSDIVSNRRLKGEYFEIIFNAPQIAGTAAAGQFVHIRINDRLDHPLRRPFSIHNAADGQLTVVYKVVGAGTELLSRCPAGERCDLLGPCGRGFSTPAADVVPVAVCGGYGVAATYLLTKVSTRPGILLLGARSAADIILTEKYAAAGFEVRTATNDGSAGIRGLVTELIPRVLAEHQGEKLFFYGCGPHPMLMALAKNLKANRLRGELSIDHYMCCGVGACFGCVVKVNDLSRPGEWCYARSCVDGPVFPLEQVYTE